MSPGCSPEEVRARKIMVMNSHPLHAHRDEDPLPTRIPPEQALSLLLEAKEQYEARLKEIEAELAILRDMA